MSVNSDRVLVVFDLDGVLARTDTMAHLLQRQLLSSPLRSVAGIVPAGLWFLLRGLPRVRPWLSRSLGRAALSGLTRARYDELARGVGQKLAADPAGWIEDGISAVHRHIEAGDDVVVTTGTERALSRAFLDAVGLADVALVATELRFGRRAVHYEHHNLGSGKVPAFADRTIALFYTDSDLDLPIARRAAHTILVNPSPRLRRLFSARIPSLEVVHWT